ncbi:hypothetical protein HPB51_015694 [Rhipicephalus microplus]|uniref:BACK domain-containing protein n=1 Tax=Rhipicephalus microplus TaxID=6941 RepID=A0A9J6D5J7_RHIMP|nr:hypothetical protein HPB51_015694 [Rhipicephalus microplus]
MTLCAGYDIHRMVTVKRSVSGVLCDVVHVSEMVREKENALVDNRNPASSRTLSVCDFLEHYEVIFLRRGLCHKRLQFSEHPRAPSSKEGRFCVGRRHPATITTQRGAGSSSLPLTGRGTGGLNKENYSQMRREHVYAPEEVWTASEEQLTYSQQQVRSSVSRASRRRRARSDPCNVLRRLQFRAPSSSTKPARPSAAPVNSPTCTKSWPGPALFGCRKIKETRSEALIPGVIKQTMAIIVEFAYKRMTRVDCDNVESLLEAADYLCVMGIIKDCCDFLVSIMTPENCISIRNVAKLYNCSGPHHEGLQNFIEVSERGEELLHLEIDEVEAIMSDENLNVIKEETVWKAVIRWIDFDSDNRKQYISRLFKCVRMGLVDTDFFVEKIKACKYVADDEACRPLVVETLRFLYDLDVMVHNQQVPTPLFVRPRIPREVVFIVGGWNAGGPTAVVETYDTKADRWIDADTTDPFGPCAYHKCAVVGFEIYVIGGFNGEDYYSRVRCFNAHTKEWRSVNPMHVKSPNDTHVNTESLDFDELTSASEDEIAVHHPTSSASLGPASDTDAN